MNFRNELVKQKEFAERFGVTDRMVRKWRRSGQVRTHIFERSNGMQRKRIVVPRDYDEAVRWGYPERVLRGIRD